jgi:hypothetical protein
VSSSSSPSPIRHFVAFKYKAGASADEIERITIAFRRLQRVIPGIVAMEHGVNHSPEGKSHGFTHAYVLTFEDAAARDSYLPHPEHVKFGQALRAADIVDDVFVFDFSVDA